MTAKIAAKLNGWIPYKTILELANRILEKMILMMMLTSLPPSHNKNFYYLKSLKMLSL
jgi:hypothetical protein